MNKITTYKKTLKQTLWDEYHALRAQYLEVCSERDGLRALLKDNTVRTSSTPNTKSLAQRARDYAAKHKVSTRISGDNIEAYDKGAKQWIPVL